MADVGDPASEQRRHTDKVAGGHATRPPTFELPIHRRPASQPAPDAASQVRSRSRSNSRDGTPITAYRRAIMGDGPVDPLSADNTWREIASCEGFDLRTWVASSAPIFSSGPSSAPPVSPSPAPSTSGIEARSKSETDASTEVEKEAETETTTTAEPTFHPFPNLPFELRAKIWRLHLQRPRLVVLRSLMLDPTPSVEVNPLGNIASDTNWYSQNRSPVLFRVCRESKAEALAFYRVHLPMRTGSLLRYGLFEEARRNPAWDVVCINPEWDLILYDGTRRSVDFTILASDVLAYDPLGKGVAHLCSNDWPKSVWQVNLDPGKGMSPLPKSLANLQTFVAFMRQVAGSTGKLGEGYITGMNMKPQRRAGGLVGGNGVVVSGGAAGDGHGAIGLGGLPTTTGLVHGAAHQPRSPDAMHSILSRTALMTKVPSRARDICVVDMGMRAFDAYASPLYCATNGWALQLKWQARHMAPTHEMYVTTGDIRDSRGDEIASEDAEAGRGESVRVAGLTDSEDLW